MTDHREFKLIVTGDYQSAEFKSRQFRDALRGFTVGFLDWHDLPNDSSVDFLFIAQSRRNQFSQLEIDQLVARFPIAQKALIPGSWCEGETRSGKPLTGIHRIYLRDLPFFLRRCPSSLNWLLSAT